MIHKCTLHFFKSQECLNIKDSGSENDMSVLTLLVSVEWRAGLLGAGLKPAVLWGGLGNVRLDRPADAVTSRCQIVRRISLE